MLDNIYKQQLNPTMCNNLCVNKINNYYNTTDIEDINKIPYSTLNSMSSQQQQDSNKYILLNGKQRIRPAIVPLLCSIRCNQTILQPYNTYYYCTCGKTKHNNRIECDNTCKTIQNNTFEPISIYIDKSTYNINICGCRYSSTLPYCDGSHMKPQLGLEERK